MLKRFEVQGYKNFKERFIFDAANVRDYQFNTQCIKNGLVNSSIIYGKNAVGKSNLGCAIMNIKDNFGGYVQEDESFLNAHNDVTFADFYYEFQFDQDIVKYSYKKESPVSLIEETLVINETIIFQYDHVNNKMIENNVKEVQANTLNWEFIEDVPSILSYIINNTPQTERAPLRKLYIFIQGMQFLRGDKQPLYRALYSGISKIFLNRYIEDDVENLESFLRDFGIDEKLVLIESPTGVKELYFQYDKPIPFFQNCSSGTLTLLQLYNWYQKISKASFLFLDEFDAFYHYDLSKQVIKLFNRTDSCQTVATSHNTDLLNNKIMRPDCLFILTKNKITSLADATSRELREGHNLEKLYVGGEFDE